MMIRHTYIWIFIVVFLTACGNTIIPSEISKEKPSIFPDYTDVTIPATIAPLNFAMNGDYSGMQVKIKGENGKVMLLKTNDAIEIHTRRWYKLLEANKGKTLEFTVSAKHEGKWIQYAPFNVHVSHYPIDYGLVYRLIAPGYEVYSKMGIYQRNLTNFDETPIIENTLITGSCVNCHSFRLTSPESMSLHIRGKKGGTLLMHNGETNIYKTKTDRTISNFVYPFWHPSGNYITYSVNNTKQVFHEAKSKRVEVIDLASDVIVYDVRKNQTIFCNRIMSDSVFETFPSFSPDGRFLYFCAARVQQMPADYQQVRYDLCRISFDPESGLLGKTIDTLFNASLQGKSVTFPRPSPDGRYIMFTLTDYGNFSIWHKEADLYLLDLETGVCSEMKEVNSSDTESYHSWSSNSRWFVFSSRRLDGLYTRPFLAQIDENGKISKPFLLPQKDPKHNLNRLYSYNIPEFVSGKVNVDLHEVEHLIQTEGTPVEQRE